MPKLDRLTDTKETVTFRISAATKRRIELAALKVDLSMSEYVEQAVQARLDKEHITATPDFAGFFAKHPPAPGGNEAMRILLADRKESL